MYHEYSALIVAFDTIGLDYQLITDESRKKIVIDCMEDKVVFVFNRNNQFLTVNNGIESE